MTKVNTLFVIIRHMYFMNQRVRQIVIVVGMILRHKMSKIDVMWRVWTTYFVQNVKEKLCMKTFLWWKYHKATLLFCLLNLIHSSGTIHAEDWVWVNLFKGLKMPLLHTLCVYIVPHYEIIAIKEISFSFESIYKWLYISWFLMIFSLSQCSTHHNL